MKRILIFCHYNKYNYLSDYVLYTLEVIRPVFEKVIFISSSLINENDKTNISRYCDLISIKKNIGFDYEAWKAAILEEGWESLECFDSLTLMNDKSFGPFHDIDTIYQFMENKKLDFWSISNDILTASGLVDKENFINSFFVFQKSVVKSQFFKDYWNNTLNFDNKNFLKHNHELTLIEIFLKKDFKYEAYSNANDSISSTDIIFDPLVLFVEKRILFLKIKNFLNFPHPKFLKKIISEHSNYPVSLIDDYFTHNYNPNISINICNKNYICSSGNKTFTKEFKIALHLHVFYIEIFDIFVDIMKTNSFQIDLFITTDSTTKQVKIEEKLFEAGISRFLKKIYVFENKGRDILPWLNLCKELENYKVAGHFHTKKSSFDNKFFGDAWMDEILSTIFMTFEDIILAFQNNRNLGIIIPDIPFYFKHLHKHSPFDGGSGKNRENCQLLWGKMKNMKHIDFLSLTVPIMPYGNMFWYRPEALKPLFDLKLSASDFSSEPISDDGTIAHAIERLPVYIAWSQGYDFRIAMNEAVIDSGFYSKINNKIIEQKDTMIYFIYNSYTWRIGRIITWLPEKVLNEIKKYFRK